MFKSLKWGILILIPFHIIILFILYSTVRAWTIPESETLDRGICVRLSFPIFFLLFSFHSLDKKTHKLSAATNWTSFISVRKSRRWKIAPPDSLARPSSQLSVWLKVKKIHGISDGLGSPSFSPLLPKKSW